MTDLVKGNSITDWWRPSMSLKIAVANVFIVIMIVLMGAVGLTTASNAEPIASEDLSTFERTHP